MIVDPKQKIKNSIFYNNLLLIMSIFSVIFFITAMFVDVPTLKTETFYDISDTKKFGPIVVKDKPKIYEIKTNMFSDNTSVYVSGEVINEDDDTLFEFGKDLWHESGYDSEGYWSESDNGMNAKITLSEPGTYYIKLNKEDNSFPDISATFYRKSGSGIPHFMVGFYLLIITLFTFIFRNKEWIKEKYIWLDEVLEEASDD